MDFIYNHAARLFVNAITFDSSPKVWFEMMQYFYSKKITDESISLEFDEGRTSDIELVDLTGLSLGMNIKKRFTRSLWQALVPVLSTERPNYDFRLQTILPFKEIPVTVERNIPKGGSFSSVHKVEIHEGHFLDPNSVSCHLFA